MWNKLGFTLHGIVLVRFVVFPRFMLFVVCWATSDFTTTFLPPFFGMQDCEDSNPLIRALAVRTMGCIRVDKITEYLCEPLRKCLKVQDKELFVAQAYS